MGRKCLASIISYRRQEKLSYYSIMYTKKKVKYHPLFIYLIFPVQYFDFFGERVLKNIFILYLSIFPLNTEMKLPFYLQKQIIL